MKIATLFVLILLYSQPMFSQETAKTGANDSVNVVKYDVSFSMDELVYHNYRLTENTKVKRIFEDSTINEYEKNVTHWFTVFVPGPKDENGFLECELTTDSITYDLKSNAKKVNYDSRDYDMEMPINFMDFFNSYVVNSANFKFLYSPYGDVSKVYGDELAENRKNFNKTLDTIKRNQIMSDVGDDNLRFLFDVPKGVYPPFEATVDTSWKSEIKYFVAHIPFSGEVTNTFKGYSNQEYHIFTVIDSLKLKHPINTYLFPDLDRYGTVEKATMSGSVSTDMFTGGTIKYVRAKLITNVSGKLSNFKYDEIIETTYTWDLLGRYSF